MSGRIVHCTNLDSVRIEVLGEGRAATIPARLILAVDRVLRRCEADESQIDIVLVDDPALPWEARLDGGTEGVGRGVSPWDAIADLEVRI